VETGGKLRAGRRRGNIAIVREGVAIVSPAASMLPFGVALSLFMKLVWRR
jgi:hypothetical protein